MTPAELWAAIHKCGRRDLDDNPPKSSPVPACITARMPDYCPVMGVEWHEEVGRWRVSDIQAFLDWAQSTELWTEEELAELSPLLVLELFEG